MTILTESCGHTSIWTVFKGWGRSPLNKSFLLFNNLYNWDVPSHKELAFKIDKSFSILLEEIDYFVLFDHILMLLQQRNSLYGDCTTGVGDISSVHWSRPSSNLGNFQ